MRPIVTFARTNGEVTKAMGYRARGCRRDTLHGEKMQDEVEDLDWDLEPFGWRSHRNRTQGCS